MDTLAEYEQAIEEVKQDADLDDNERAAAYSHLADEIGGIAWQSHMRQAASDLAATAAVLAAELINDPAKDLDLLKGEEGLVRKGAITIRS